MEAIYIMIITFGMVGPSGITGETLMKFEGFDSKAQCEEARDEITETMPDGVIDFTALCVPVTDTDA